VVGDAIKDVVEIEFRVEPIELGRSEQGSIWLRRVLRPRSIPRTEMI
jgi:hypothetical protein